MVTIWWSLDLISQLPDSQGILILASVADGPKDFISGKLFQVIVRQTQMWARRLTMPHCSPPTWHLPGPNPTLQILGPAHVKPDACIDGELHECSCLSPSPASRLGCDGQRSLPPRQAALLPLLPGALHSPLRAELPLCARHVKASRHVNVPKPDEKKSLPSWTS